MSKRNKIIIIVLALLLTCFIIIGISYAYWKITYTQSTSNKIATSCFSMELTNEKNDITLESAYPISDENGKKLIPYSFTITNTCDLFASYTINIEILNGTTLDSKYIKTMINNEEITNFSDLEITDTTIEGATESRILFKGSLGNGDSTDYTFRLWMDSETPPTEDTMNKIFQAKISVVGEAKAYSPVENGFTLLNEALLVNEYQTISLETAKNNITNKQKVDFTKTAPFIEWGEKKKEITKKTFTKVSTSMIGVYDVNEEKTKILLSPSYTFDSTTGYYNVSGIGSYYDPLNIDYNSGSFYTCGSGTTLNSFNETVTSWNSSKCYEMYEILSFDSVKESVLKFESGAEVMVKEYTYNVSILTGEEIESDKSDKGLYEATDDDGTTYYYRGNVVNNYVSFSNQLWRIVRINGDGSIRLLFEHDSLNPENCTNCISSKYNNLNTNPTYVGYMYSNTLDSSYEDTISNDNDSAIKKTLDNWYKTNILELGYSEYIADSGFCNDRSIAPNSSGTGATSFEEITYSPKYRMLNHTPTFTCSNQSNDLFTLSGNSKGNGKLTYPIGLVTIDELAYAGSAYGSLNKMTYTFNNSTFWTMSPSYFSVTGGMGDVWRAGSGGSIGSSASVSLDYIVRPVINLKADTEISGGIGTANDPFIIK